MTRFWQNLAPDMKVISAGIFIAAIFLLGIGVGSMLPDASLPVRELRSQKNDNFEYVSPLLQCDVQAESSTKQVGQLKTQVERVIAQFQDEKPEITASVNYFDLNSGAWFGIRSSQKFAPASLIKLPVLLAFYKRAEQNPSLLLEEIVITQEYEYEENQNYLPEDRLEMGEAYTVAELIRRMIVYSDNHADLLLRELLTDEEFFGIFDSIGVDLRKTNSLHASENIVTVQEYSLIFRMLYNASYLTDHYSEQVLALLAQTEFEDGLVAGVSKSTRVAHKFGERRYVDTGELQLHDCGIVYASSGPYVLCIMTSGSSFTELQSVIKQISQTVFAYH